MVFIWHKNLSEDREYKDKNIVSQLEDAWLELDTIISEEILWNENS